MILKDATALGTAHGIPCTVGRLTGACEPGVEMQGVVICVCQPTFTVLRDALTARGHAQGQRVRGRSSTAHLHGAGQPVPAETPIYSTDRLSAQKEPLVHTATVLQGSQPPRVALGAVPVPTEVQNSLVLGL